MSNRASDVLSIANGEIGYDRFTDPAEGTKYGNWYAGITGSPYFGTTGVPYCAMFTSWCFAQAGAICVGLPAASTRVIYNAAKAAGRLRASVRDAQPGDVFLIDWSEAGTDDDGDPRNLDHTCLCEINLGDSGVQTIEGNVANGKVQRRVRSWAYIAAVVAPDYATLPDVPSPSSDTSVGNLDGEDGELLVDGDFGPITIKNLQRTLQFYSLYQGYLIDGDFAYQTKLALQQYLQSKGYYQGYLLDGDFSGNSVYALQQYFKDLGYYWYTADGIRYWCDLDGDWGEYTTKAFQRALNSERF